MGFSWLLKATASMCFFAKLGIFLFYWIAAISFLVVYALKDKDLPLKTAHIIYWICNLWVVFTLYMSVILVIILILRHFIHSINQPFLLSLIIVAVIFVLGFLNYKKPKTKNLDIAISKQMNNYNNLQKNKTLRIAALSDIHLGYGTTKKAFEKTVKIINQLHPDIILIAGDLFDMSCVPLEKDGFKDAINQLNAPMGIYMCMGNHEYISGREKSIDFIKRTKIKLLIDSVAKLDNGLQIIGRDDKSNDNRLPLKNLIKSCDKNKPVFLLDHQPYDNEIETANKMQVDFALYGHTHRGQFFPINLITSALYRQDHGFKKYSYSNILVSSGLFLWGQPLRIGSNNELWVVNIRF